MNVTFNNLWCLFKYVLWLFYKLPAGGWLVFRQQHNLGLDCFKLQCLFAWPMDVSQNRVHGRKKYMAVIYLKLRHNTHFLIENQGHFLSCWDGVTCHLYCCYRVFEIIIFTCPAWHSGSTPVITAPLFSSKASSSASLSLCFGAVNSSGSRYVNVTHGFLLTTFHTPGQWSIFWDSTFSELCGKRSSLCFGKSVVSGGHLASMKLESTWMR